MLSLPIFGQSQYRRFTRTPYYTGPNDPERGKIRGTIKLGETVIIDVPGDTGDTDLKPGVVPDPNVTPPRGSRPGGPFEIEGVKPRDWFNQHHRCRTRAVWIQQQSFRGSRPHACPDAR